MIDAALAPSAQTSPHGVHALKELTSAAHRRVEAALDLPASIATQDDYRRWLVRFCAIYDPLEALLASHRVWPVWGISLAGLGHRRNLHRDLEAMSLQPQHVPLAPDSALPSLPTFAHAFGALYVIEGSKLGGRYILRDLSARLGPCIEPATAFFSGHGENSASRWNAFKQSLDRFLQLHPEEFLRVVAGADATFFAIERWMVPLRRGCEL